MNINSTIFKSYDIRGIYPEELNENTAYLIGRAFARQTGAKKIAIGKDARLASPQLFLDIAKGLFDEGVKIYDIGQVPTECLYFAVGKYEFDAGIMITASHNPKEYNGFKMVKKDGANIKIISGKELFLFVKEGEVKMGKEAEIEKIDIWEDYINHIFSFVDVNKLKPFKIAVDASNGVAGVVLEKIKGKLPIEIIPLNFEPDGNFPNHSPNPLAEGSANQIKESIIKEKADFGFIFDGDADRVFLTNENGQIIRADITLLFLAKYFLERNSGSAISYNVICSKAVPEFIKKWGGLPIKTQVGFVNVREGIIKNSGVMGGELSGHYCFKDNFYLDSGMIAFLVLLQIISQENKKVSELAKDLSPYAKSSEINFEVKEKEAIINKIKEKHTDGKQDFLDGITVEYDNWWFNVRPSNTEPLLRLTIEAGTEELLEQKKKELSYFISNN